jgi:glycosyltransferase involved in cell wall biosynthesis
MRVSTVIPVYNRQDLIRHAIESAQMQGLEDHEIVVIDNCSTDSTWSVIQEMAATDHRIRSIKNERNVGPVRNWRLGVEAARGEYCHLLFSDDWIEPDFLRECLAVMDSDTAFVLTGHTMWGPEGPYEYSTFESNAVISRDEFLDAGVFLNPKQIQLITPLSALFRRRDMLDALLDTIPNPFGIDFAGHGAGPDQLLFLLTAIRYPLVRCVNRHLVAMRYHPGSITVAAKDLSLPREWTRWYFVQNHWPEVLPRYRSMLWVRGAKNKACRLIGEHVQTQVAGRPSMVMAVSFTWRWMWQRIFARWTLRRK